MQSIAVMKHSNTEFNRLVSFLTVMGVIRGMFGMFGMDT